MGIFNFLGTGQVISTAGGAAVGVGLTHAYHYFTTGKKLKTLTERLGDPPIEAQERALRKVAILKVLAHKDGDFSVYEQNFIYRYIAHCPDLPADIKVTLAIELEKPLPNAFSDILANIRSKIKFLDLFKTDEDAAGFVSTMLSLANADGVLDDNEVAYIQKVCSDCKVPPHLFPVVPKSVR